METYRKEGCSTSYSTAKPLLFLFLFVFVVSLTNVSAGIGTYAQNSCVDIKAILNSTSVNLSTVSYPNSSLVLSQQIMNKTGQTFNYTFCNTSALGTYNYDYFDNFGNVYTNTFEISSSGLDLTTSESIIYLFLLITLLFIFFVVYFSIGLLPEKNKQDQDGKIVDVNKLKYFRPILWYVEWIIFTAILFLAGNIAFAYLGEQLFSQFLLLLARICLWANLIVIPVWVGYLIAQIVDDNKIMKLIERGIYPQGGI